MAPVYASITQAEAQTRARALEVRSYSVDLDLTRGEELFGSSTVIRFGCTQPGVVTFLDLRPSALHRVVLNGRDLDPNELRDGRFVLRDLSADNEVLVEAEMAYTHTGEGMHRFVDPADGETYVYTQCGPDEAPRVFACFDQPDLKGVFDVTVTAPPHWTVLSNGAGERRDGGRWEFGTTQPISTYLMVVVGGPLHSVRTQHGEVPLGLHCRRSLAAHLDANADDILDVTRRSFDRYHRLFDERYPFGKYDQAFVPEFNWGAVENPGCVTFLDDYLFRSAVTETEAQSRAVVIAHELAHMWFGDLVTMRWWDDLWLNESFAELMGYEVVTDATDHAGAWTTFAVRRKPWGYDADQRPSTHAVAAQSIGDAAAALANFDGISYAKGAAALRQLVVWIGPDAFFAGVNDHFARHRFGNATLADLVDALARTSGRDVHAWTDRWLRTSGVDTMRPELVERNGLLESAAITVAGPPDAPSRPRPHRILVGAYDLRPGNDDRGQRLVLRERFETDVDAQQSGSSREVPLPQLVGAPRPDLLVLNDGDLSYTKVRWDERSWQSVRAALSTVDDEVTRALLWSTARDLVRDGELTPDDYLALADAHLPVETRVAIVEEVLRFGQRGIADRYVAASRRPAALATLTRVGRAILTRAAGGRAGTGIRLAAVRGLIASAATDDELAELQEWLRAERVPDGPDLDPELRWAILLRLSTSGAVDVGAIQAELTRDASATGEANAARCRSARPDLEAKESAWRLLFSDTGLSKRLLAAVASGFWQPDQGDLLAGYVERYFAEIPAMGALGPSAALTLGKALFPAYSATPDTVALAEKCLAREGLTLPLRRALADELDDLRRALRVRTGEGA